MKSKIKQTTIKINGKKTKVQVKRYLNLTERGMLVLNIANGVFVAASDDEQTADMIYAPYMFQPVALAELIQTYTDLDLSEYDAETMWDIEQQTGCFGKLLHDCREEIDGILLEAYSLIESKCKRSKLDDVLDRLSNLLATFDGMNTQDLIMEILNARDTLDKDEPELTGKRDIK